MKREVWVHTTSGYKREAIPAQRLMHLLYQNPAGKASLLFLAKRKMLSRLYGAYCRTHFSARMIPGFIEEYEVDMAGCSGNYKSFAEFFSREKTGLSFPEDLKVLGSPCEGLARAYTNIDPKRLIAAKGSTFSLSQLLGSKALANSYCGGNMVAVRLTPANYHRVHFFDSGAVKARKLIDGDLYSVNPLAVESIARLYCQNKRAVTLFASHNFGNVAMVEVGATFVGSIVYCTGAHEQVVRGQQASYFLPGGSLLLMFFGPGIFVPCTGLLEQTSAGYETKVQVGQPLGQKV